MGQQQLLLIVLAIILVGIAIAISTTLFDSNATSSNRDAVISDLNHLGAIAIEYYKKPKNLNGGGNKFTGWKLPAELDTTANGNYVLTVSAQSITIRGYGVTRASNGNKIQYLARVTPSGVTISKRN